jgi:hypothetical protein
MPRMATWSKLLAGVAAGVALAATFWAYTSPNLVLDIGTLMQWCGLR